MPKNVCHWKSLKSHFENIYKEYRNNVFMIHLPTIMAADAQNYLLIVRDKGAEPFEPLAFGRNP